VRCASRKIFKDKDVLNADTKRNITNTAPNNSDWRERTRLLLKDEGLAALKKAHVTVVGLGGVGAEAAEKLVRAGVGRLTIIDHDIFEVSNRNRQLMALDNSTGQEKTAVYEERFRRINKELELTAVTAYLANNNLEKIIPTNTDWLCDCIDTLTPKVDLIAYAQKKGIQVISALGSGGKTDPAQIAVIKLSETYNCRLAYYLRKFTRRAGVDTAKIPVVFSSEKVPAHARRLNDTLKPNQKSTVGTVSYMPAMFGCYMAAYVIQKIIAIDAV